MEYLTISGVSRSFHVTTRTLRYYEEIGLLKSTRREDYAYRVYDEEAVCRLRQILVLRQLRIPLRQIMEILSCPDTARAVRILEENVARLDREIGALETIRRALATLASRLPGKPEAGRFLALLLEYDTSWFSALPSFQDNHFREEPTMDDLTRANDALRRFDNTRIVYIPPATVAASHSLDPEPENAAGAALNRFIVAQRLFERKPDFRVFGFNNPNPTPENDFHGYELWVTIPEDMEVPAPLVKKKMQGGVYAAHCIRMGNFEEWGPFWQWTHDNEVCAYEEREPLSMSGSLEEHLNAYSTYAALPPEDCENISFAQLDLLIPVKLK